MPGARRTRSDDEALADVLRLSRGMTYKTALAGLPYGGAKAVILGRPTREALRAFGRAVDSLGGTYVTAEDVGIGRADLAVMKEETPWVLGADDVGGVAAPFTALGVFQALRGALRHLGIDLPGLTVAVQGTGAVGSRLCALLRDAGARARRRGRRRGVGRRRPRGARSSIRTRSTRSTPTCSRPARSAAC